MNFAFSEWSKRYSSAYKDNFFSYKSDRAVIAGNLFSSRLAQKRRSIATQKKWTSVNRYLSQLLAITCI